MPENEIALERAAELAQAVEKLQIVAVTAIVLILVAAALCWMAYKHDLKRAAEARYRAQNDATDVELALTVELSKPARHRDPEFWAAWCKEQQLPTSTANVLMAGARGDRRG